LANQYRCIILLSTNDNGNFAYWLVVDLRWTTRYRVHYRSSSCDLGRVMIERQAHIKELADIVFDGKPTRMAYLRERISKLTDEEMLELVQKIDSVFQQYAESI
jgi:hypothetical protein